MFSNSPWSENVISHQYKYPLKVNFFDHIFQFRGYHRFYLQPVFAKKAHYAWFLPDLGKCVWSSGSCWGWSSFLSPKLDLLLRERGFELYWELQRRTDMIRFGKYEDTWTEKSNKDKFKRLFPIPQTAIDGASNIPGYLKQNQSYWCIWVNEIMGGCLGGLG